MPTWFFKFLGIHFITPPEGGGGTPPPEGKQSAPNDLEAKLAAALAEIEKLKAAPPKGDDPDLAEKAKRERAALDKSQGDVKTLESSIRFTMQAPDFLKTNASLLPKDVEDIFKAADKEVYSNATEKANDLKAGLIHSFFNVQENLDLLTPGQRSSLDDFRKLAKTGKQEKAHTVYEMIFEPAFERLKSEKRAKALNGGGGGSDADAAYAQKIMKKSNTHYGIQERK